MRLRSAYPADRLIQICLKKKAIALKLQFLRAYPLTFLGLPPFFPLALDATCFFSELDEPPILAICFIQTLLPKIPNNKP
jgi:hypothetical protein